MVDFLNGGLADLIYGGFSAYAHVPCRSSTMTTYLVATLSIYVLVDVGMRPKPASLPCRCCMTNTRISENVSGAMYPSPSSRCDRLPRPRLA